MCTASLEVEGHAVDLTGHAATTCLRGWDSSKSVNLNPGNFFWNQFNRIAVFILPVVKLREVYWGRTHCPLGAHSSFIPDTCFCVPWEPIKRDDIPPWIDSRFLALLHLSTDNHVELL